MARQTKLITVGDVKSIAYELALTLEWKESIPPFETRFPGKLEGALSAPFQSFGGYSKYRGVAAKAAALFFFMVKDHPFQNGNKRIALTTTLVYLYRNGYWIKMPPEDLYTLAIWIAESPKVTAEGAVNALKAALQKSMYRS